MPSKHTPNSFDLSFEDKSKNRDSQNLNLNSNSNSNLDFVQPSSDRKNDCPVSKASNNDDSKLSKSASFVADYKAKTKSNVCPYDLKVPNSNCDVEIGKLQIDVEAKNEQKKKLVSENPSLQGIGDSDASLKHPHNFPRQSQFVPVPAEPRDYSVSDKLLTPSPAKRHSDGSSKNVDNYEMIIEEDKSYTPQVPLKIQTERPSFTDHPEAGTLFGGGGGGPKKQTSEKSLDHISLMLRVTELWSDDKVLLKCGQERNKDHTRRVNEKWDAVERTLRSEKIAFTTNLRKSFIKFKNDTFNKIRSMTGTGAAAPDFNKAEKYLKDLYHNDQGVTGIEGSDDVGFNGPERPPLSRDSQNETEDSDVEEINPRQDEHEQIGRPRRQKKATQVFTFGSEPVPKKRKKSQIETPMMDNLLHQSNWDTPSSSLPFSSRRNSVRAATPESLATSPQFSTRRPTLNLSTYQRRSTRTESSANFFDGSFHDDEEDVRSVQSIDDNEPAGTPLRIQRNSSQNSKRAKKTLQQKTGVDKPVTKGPTPMSKKGQFLADGLEIMTESFTASAELIDRESQLRIDELQNRAKIQKAMLPNLDELAAISKQKLQAEADEAASKAERSRYEAEKAKEEAELKKIERQKAEIELQKMQLELQKLQNNS
uniref:Uncharacterized protein n=1 Tax=Panagrolaimus davidi TaxID=227884 RepID=A0A914QWZ8_9BILA